MYKLLSEKEKVMIQAYIDEYPGRDANPETKAGLEDLEYVLRFWSKEKSRLFKMFGDKLILERPLNKTQSIAALEGQFFMEADETVVSFYSAITNPYFYLANYNYRNAAFTKMLDQIDKDIITNRYSGDNEVFEFKDKKLKVQKNMSVIKLIEKISKIFSIPNFEEFRLYHSQILNQKTQNGVLCLSIHPLDYMTMSDNTYNWRSCMHWDTGEYSQGTVEMMNSPFVVVAYIKGKDELPITENYNWNSKKWRELFIVHPDAICGIKGYPYTDRELEAECLSWLRELASGVEELGSYEEKITELDPELWTTEDGIEFSFTTMAMYNDVECHCIAMLLSTKVKENCKKEISIHYSGVSECVWCGEEIDIEEWSFRDYFSLLCDRCEKLIF